MATPAIRTFLADIDGYDPDAVAVTTLHVATQNKSFKLNRDFLEIDSDTGDLWLLEEGGTDMLLVEAPGASDLNYTARLKEPGDFESYLFSPGKTFGETVSSYGKMVLVNANGALDYLFNWGFDSRGVVIYKGFTTYQRDEFAVWFTGTIDTVDTLWTKSQASTIEFTLRDRWQNLRVPFQDNRYAGTNAGPVGIEGTPDDIMGRVKPVALGENEGVPGILVNASKLIYQLHDSAGASTGLKQIISVKNAGVPLTLDTSVGTAGDFADLTSLQGATIAAGKYVTCLALGLLRLQTTPLGDITVALKGEVNDAGGTYTNTVSGLVLKVADRFGLAVNTDSFTALALANTMAAGIYIANDSTPADVVNKLVGSIGGFAYYPRDNDLTVGQLLAPSGSPVISITYRELIDIEKRRVEDTSRGLPIYKVVLNYRKNYRVQRSGELAGAATAAQRAFSELEYRSVTSEDLTVLTKHPLAEIMTRDTLLSDETEAQTEADRLLALYKEDRQRYIVTIKSSTIINLNDVVELKVPRFGLTAGKLFRVLGVRETASKNQLVLDIYG